MRYRYKSHWLTRICVELFVILMMQDREKSLYTRLILDENEGKDKTSVGGASHSRTLGPKRLPVCIAGVTIWLWRDKVLIKVSLKYLRIECFVFPSSPMAGESRSSLLYTDSLHSPFTACANIMRSVGCVFMLCISWNFDPSIDHMTNWWFQIWHLST